MKTYLECIPCFLRQALDAAKLAGLDDACKKNIMDKVALILPDISLNQSPPAIAEKVYKIVNECTGVQDPYKNIKKNCNSFALELYPKMKKVVEASNDALLSAVRLAVAGNVIDYGVSSSFNIAEEIEECLSKNFAIFDFDSFRDRVKNAENILYLLDNAGEIVFDKILVEEINKPVVCAARGVPIINDVTLDDAAEVGLDKVATVISSGSSIPGTLPEQCTAEFKEYYNKADLIISKGQGNYETLQGEKKPIFFIFKAKCPVVAKHLECSVGDIILKEVKM